MVRFVHRILSLRLHVSSSYMCSSAFFPVPAEANGPQRAACLVMLGRFENLAVWCGGGTVPWLTGSLRGRAKDELWLRDVGISMCFESSTDIEAVMHTF